MADSTGEVTLLLQRLSAVAPEERKGTYNRLISLVYEDLRRRARQQMRHEWDWATLQPTVLVHEAYQHLLHYNMTYETREHFLNAAASAMRRLLVDHARRKRAAKRGGEQEPTLLGTESAIAALRAEPEQLIDLDRALQGLRPEQIQLVELRYFIGLTVEETAEIMHVPPETLKKRWQVIKLLLYDKLRGSRSAERR